MSFETFIMSIDPVNNLGFISNNDFEKTVYKHPQMPWENVFYGSSIIAGSYIEENSGTNYINFGITYGKITDLKKGLYKDLIKVEKNIVIGMNFFTFMDELQTDPTYIWHKKPYVPYVYFYRGPIMEYFKETIDQYKEGQPINQVPENAYRKYITLGSLSDKELEEKITKYKELYGNLTIEDFNENIEDLKEVIDYCKDNDIRLRAIWMPWNPKDEQLDYVEELKVIVNEIFEENQIDYLDWSNKYESHYFYDLGHLNYNKGAL